MSFMAGLSNALSRRKIRSFLISPQTLALLPVIMLAGYWLWGETTLLAVALIVPVFIAVLGRDHDPLSAFQGDLRGVGLRKSIETALDHFLKSSINSWRRTTALMIELDDFDALVDRLGHKAGDDILRRAGDRLQGVLRDQDAIVRLDGGIFAIALAPAPRADLEALIQISARLQSAISEPISLDATTIYVTCSIGFCLKSRAPIASGDSMLDAAGQALSDAKQNGPSAIRGFSAEMQLRGKSRDLLIEEVSAALDNGQILPWFQPQVSTDTGEVTGFEALARWHHPERGMIPPADFLPILDQAGLFERLGEVILYQSLKSLTMWDEQGFKVPKIGVNFCSAELRNPKLVDKIRWELDRFNLEPERLTVEILETVVADMQDDIITRNIAGLAKLGCLIDLDDFGTGHASIANIRRFAVGRIKIDRSFVMKVDTDPEQQRMVSAILTMAEQLGLETIGEGVETLGEHTMLAQLGCGHIQGFGLARPMPFADTIPWMEKHREKLAQTPKIGRCTG